MSSSSEFAQHAAPEAEQPEVKSGGKLTLLGKIGLFLVAPLGMGVCGLYMAYLQTLRNPSHEISFDRDFIMPSILTLALIVVVGFQTGGFSDASAKPMIKWPKVKKVKKVVYKKKEQ